MRKEDPNSLWEDFGKQTKIKEKANEDQPAVPQNLEVGVSEIGKDLVERSRHHGPRFGRRHVI
ncbi:MAG: hypothetical protein A3B47_00750 [Candidatus Levybacteria bacterium RIFCSPLOWO2_01_FULL_39_24]|nr:MAG: hypothetical protein A2800_02785 [Candidatus Levybacteria bacterium RIFCSPHIGHO2_01_FULL_40_16]OGH27837.1 MAG: hypothetical protein A3E12_01025 [Candidatus Levybacteria bacterium RIFCSPHIGHO2_12_FULL_39_9]OGH45911.1 MAG: hypothetical protein A3B47_00750 [Candidatus Levybacteria bacterium RIFCSPLOWO2_01_FULL_39_24]